MNSKICTMCNQALSLDMFPSTSKNSYSEQRRNSPSHEGRCRPCKAAYARDWRKRNPSYVGSGKLKNVPTEDRFLASAISQRLTDAKTRAEKYGQPVPDVDREYLYELFKEQGGKCALSGVTLRVEKRAVACLSLDKVKPDLGYIKGNVQWVAWAVNRAKGDMEEEVFFDMCRQITEYRKVQRLS